MWLWVVAVVVMIGAITVLVAGSGSTLADVYDDRPDSAVPTGRPLTADDLGKVRFSTAVRGYRMDEVDALVDRLRADLLSRESARLAAADRGPASPEAVQSEPSDSTTARPVAGSGEPDRASDTGDS